MPDCARGTAFAELAFLPHIRFRANETAYEAGGRHRYYALRLELNVRSYRLCDIERSPFAEVALSTARRNDGATLAEIADAVVAAADGIEAAEALDYVRGLVRIGLLCSTLIPPVTGRDGLGHLIEELRRIPPAADVAATLESIGDDLAALDAEASVSDDDAPDVIAGKLQALSADIDVSRPIRVDLRKPCDGVTLSRTIAEEIAKGVEVLAAITPERDGALEKFAVEFEARYQGREVPLLEVLDVESGIGFEQPRSDPSALVKDLKFLESKHKKIKWTRVHDSCSRS